MLLKLPYEITLNIISHLEFKDKVNLKTTCHKVSDLITHAVLYEELDLLYPRFRSPDYYLYNNEPNYARTTIKKLLTEQLDGSLVRVLRLYIDDLTDQEISDLPNHFPNVTKIIVSNKRRLELSERQYYSPREFKNMTNPLIKWRNTIQEIISACDWNELKKDVLRSKYPRLTKLDLGGVCFMLTRCLKDHSLSFFNNAPLLTSLTIRDARITLEILEAMHTGFPLLQSLTLFNPDFLLEKRDTLLPSIAPANSMIILELLDAHYVNTYEPVLSYFLKKYPNLQKLIYNVHPHYDYFIKTREQVIVRSSSNEEEAEKYISRELALSKANFLIYSAFESAFFSNFPKSLKTLTLNIFNIENAISALAESDSKITCLNFREESVYYKRGWANSKVLGHFKMLTSLRTLKIELKSSVQAFTPEFVSLSVTRLVVALFGDAFSIEWILSMFPSLEELHIKRLERYRSTKEYSEIIGRLIHDNDDSDGSDDSDNGNDGNNNKDTESIQSRKEYPNLRILSIKNHPIHSDFFDFIRTTVPNLDELNFTVRGTSSLPPTSSKAKPYTFDLSNWNLTRCSMSFKNVSDNSYVHCTVAIQNASKYLLIDADHQTLMPSNQEYKIEERANWIEIKTNGIQHFKICGFPIVKIGNKIVID